MIEKCTHDPTQFKNLPIGMYHCPQCGEMVLASIGHPEPDKYFICEECGSLKTQTEINDDINQGSMGLCGCRYVDYQWNHKERYFEPVYFRCYSDYTEIPKDVYEGLKSESNELLRLMMYGTFNQKL